jgi:hypothetical protein
MSQIQFTSVLRGVFRHSLEQLLFFNEHQRRLQGAILSTIERYGAPRIVLLNDRLRVTLDSGVEAQTLFAVEQTNASQSLVGMVVYTREGESFVVLFVAVREDFTSRGPRAEEALFFHIIDQIKSVARRVRGIRSIKVFCPAMLEIPVWD